MDYNKRIYDLSEGQKVKMSGSRKVWTVRQVAFNAVFLKCESDGSTTSQTFNSTRKFLVVVENKP